MIEPLSRNPTGSFHRYTIWLVAFLIIFILAGVTVFEAWSGYRQALEDEKNRLLRIAALDSARLKSSLEQLQRNMVFIGTLARSEQTEGGGSNLGVLDSGRKVLGSAEALGLFDRHGRLIRQAKSDKTTPPLILPPQLLTQLVARSATSQTPVLVLDMQFGPELDNGSRAPGPVIAAVSLPDCEEILTARLPDDTFSRLSALLTPSPAGSTASLVNADGFIVGRFPDPLSTVGRNVKNGPAYVALLKADTIATALVTRGAADGIQRAVAAHHFIAPNFPSMVIVITRDVDNITKAWKGHFYSNGLFFLLAAGAIIFMTVLATRREYRLKQAAAALEESAGIYQSLFEGSRAAKLLIDPADGRIVDANHTASKYYGWTREEICKKNISDINVLSNSEIKLEMDAARQEKRNHFYFRHCLSSGEIRDVEVHSGPITFRDRKLLYSLILDITDRRRLERERQLLVTAIEQSPASVVITDASGAIQYVNPAFTAISGYTADEVMGENPRFLKSGHTSDAEYQEMWAALSQGRPWSAIFLNKRKDGSTYWEHAQIAPVIDAEGKIANYVGVKENVSALKEAEDWLIDANAKLTEKAKQLQEANAELEKFAYIASHDLRQPLRAISSYLKLIERSLSGRIDTDTEECLGFALDGAKRMDALIVGLLEYSRIGRISRPFEAVALSNIIEIVTASYLEDIETGHASLTIAPDLPTIVGDATELERLFSNLIGNALKYRFPDRAPQIEIGWRCDEKEVVIWVQDNGIGIEAKDFQRAFGMFQRLVSREQFDGTGIGLAVCKKITEHHGGRIWVESEPKHGSRFIIALPADKIVDNGAETTPL